MQPLLQHSSVAVAAGAAAGCRGSWVTKEKVPLDGRRPGLDLRAAVGVVQVARPEAQRPSRTPMGVSER